MPSPPPPDMTARARLKWPNVPASYGWLALDARGRWRIQGELITHPGIRDFLARQYDVDAGGQWFVQNGPQRAYVDLELAPWVLSLGGHGELLTHTGRAIARVETVVVADGSEILLGTDAGLGALLDHDLSAFLSGFRSGTRPLTDEEAADWLLEDTTQGLPTDLRWRQWPIAILRLSRSALATRFGFISQPRAPTADQRPTAPAT